MSNTAPNKDTDTLLKEILNCTSLEALMAINLYILAHKYFYSLVDHKLKFAPFLVAQKYVLENPHGNSYSDGLFQSGCSDFPIVALVKRSEITYFSKNQNLEHIKGVTDFYKQLSQIDARFKIMCTKKTCFNAICHEIRQ